MRRNETTLDPKIWPFSNGTQYACWRDSNCDECVLAATETRKPRCNFEVYCVFGEDMPESEAMKYGFNPFTGQMQNCPRKQTSWAKRPKRKPQDENQLSIF